MDIYKMLNCYNLTNQESNLYVLLCSKGKLTGYEAAKLSGISRSNTYTALAGLVEKGAANIEEGTAIHYIPVPIEEFCDNRIRSMIEYRELLKQSMPKQQEEVFGYITIKGEVNIFNKMKNMINETKGHMYLALSEQTLVSVIDEVKAAIDRGLKVVIITSSPFYLEGAIIYHTSTKEHQIRLITDSKNVLTGDTALGSESTCLYSQKGNLVEIFKEALKNEIKLIELMKGSN